MRVETDTNLVFDDNDSRCKIETIQLRGEIIRVAIVQCFDKRRGDIHQYIGKYDLCDIENSIRDIMGYGRSFERIIREFKDK